MSKVITFSRTFPAYHPRKGEPTRFVEKMHKSLDNGLRDGCKLSVDLQLMGVFNFAVYSQCEPKHHTIRAGNRWKVGDIFSPRVWSGKPYQSKQIIIGPDIEIKKAIPIGLRIRGDFKEFYCNDCDLTGTCIIHLAANDGLSTKDFFSWFNKPFEGQIICWNENINY